MTAQTPSLPLLDVAHLGVTFRTPAGDMQAVRDVSFSLAAGETLALVGESGSGKSVTALSILQLLPYPGAQHPAGSSIRLEGQELVGAGPRLMQKIRGNRIGMVFQEPMTSLNPLHTIEQQVAETLRLHKGLSREQARPHVLSLLTEVGFANAQERLGAYPHELSGGQRQRVMIAMALANDPALLIADEPTTALDVTIQAQILDLLKQLQQRKNLALLLITHDLGIVRKVADRVAVMQKGQIVEQGPLHAVFSQPQHPYTRLLLEAEPRGQALPSRPDSPTLLDVHDLKVWFPVKTGWLRRTTSYVKAVDEVSFSLKAGETLGIVGESGSGKTTLGQAVLRLIRSEGRIVYLGRDLQGQSWKDLRPLRREMQVVFQDPYGSLSPRLSMGEIIAEGLGIHAIGRDAAERTAMVDEVLQEVGLSPEMKNRYPHEFSGGQRQRVAIARALVLRPRLIVLDEPTSALDMTVQAQIVDLLRALQDKHHLAYIFISHDLRVVRALSSHILVMKNGRIVEQGPAESVFSQPQQPYTQALLKAALHHDTLEN